MLRKIVAYFSVCLIAIAFGACNTPADHARYIPKDALAVTSLNTKALSKKVAWDIITGSKLFKQMQGQMQDKNATNLDESGIDLVNTYYVYIRSTGQFQANTITGLIPLANEGKWEAYVTKVFPGATIKSQGIRKLANMGNGLYAGWNSSLLIIINSLPIYEMMGPDGNKAIPNTPAVNDSLAAVEIENAFAVTKENALTGNAHFAKLLQEGHDISWWLNYDQLMTRYMAQGMAKMMSGITLSNVLWKDAAMAAGMDFDKGKITGDMHYYVGDDMREAAKELGGTNADKDMLDRLPKQNLDMVMSMHLAPKGLKAMLDKTGMLGLANLALSAQGMNADYVMDAFTGDMAVALSDLDVQKATAVADNAMQYNMRPFGGYKPSLNAVYVLKINKKENFDRLLQLGISGSMVRINANTYAIPLSATDSVIVMTDKNYAVVANRTINALNYIQGNNKGQNKAAAAKIYGHPFGFYTDVQEMLKWVTTDMTGDAATNAKMAAAKNLVENMLVTGGAYSNNAFNYHMDVDFVNKDENSLLTLMDFGIKMQDNNSLHSAK